MPVGQTVYLCNIVLGKQSGEEKSGGETIREERTEERRGERTRHLLNVGEVSELEKTHKHKRAIVGKGPCTPRVESEDK